MNIAFLNTAIHWPSFNHLLGLGSTPVCPSPETLNSSRSPAAPNPEPSRPLTSTAAQASRPLRVVRLMEVGQAPSQVGRMVISGRMADVCAELDRLVAREAAMH